MQIPMVIFWSIALLFFVRTQVSCLDPFSEALLGLKSELVDSSNSLYDWSSVPSNGNSNSTVPACSWSGVKCTKNSSMIIGLDLSQRNLSGSISGKNIKVLVDLVDLNLSYNSFSGQLPTDVFNLTNLRSLDIGRNNFNGNFPDGISAIQRLVVFDAFSNSFSGPLPTEIARLESLKVLNLAGSYFDGPIPREYGSFKSLEFLHLAGNLLSGEIPPELGNLKTVTHVEIGYNFYHGSIPWQLGSMTKLQYLDMAHANLSGPIPDYLSNLANLHTLFLFRNQLSGSIPWSFGNITSLMNIDLSENQLSGSIPKSFAGLKNLRLLSLMYNSMSGSIPDGIADLPLLDTLLIWNNLFSGPLPQSLGRNSQLKWLDVSTNGFTGIVPPDLCSGVKLLKLILFSNNFTGGLSLALSNCSSLIRLRIEDNSFSGTIPLKFDILPNITYVDLSRNRFTGGIPNNIYKAGNLQYFNISQNSNLGGTVPSRIWSLPLLQNFSASLCNISGNLPPFKSCDSISTIELNRNQLSGTIPGGVLQCQSLERMDLSKNQLMGQIPPELASLPTLSFIDVSHNKLTGSIPAKFGNSSELVLLNVSFNNISGSIPPDDVFRSMGSNAFIGNPQLCGPPLQPCPDSTQIPHVAGFGLGSKSSEKLVWVLSLCSGVVLLIMVSIFGILYIYRRKRGQWKMVSFIGLPRFTANDVLRSLNCSNSIEISPSLSAASYCKGVLPTGITVAVKKIEWEAKRRNVLSEFIKLIGKARHRNLIRLLGYCSNEQVAYLLYDYLPNGNLEEKMRMKRDSPISTWAAKYKTVIGIARGLCHLHHDCYPVVPHGDLRSSNVVFDENMEPHLAEFGLKRLMQMNSGSIPRRSGSGTGELETEVKEEIHRDIYSFGEVLLEILTNGRLKNAGASIQAKPREDILQDVYHENEECPTDASREEIKLVLEVALLCTRSTSSDRPSMEDAVRLLSGLRPNRSN
ncbi:leucine-rich repeat receptor-like protein kinase TDR [Magnolia sinica]|uniref:leucine-rich repeat receptor-like protein kinase TDR n=1 Tax=Magnolia sinica TaxID=86752 RepID=UPI00265AA854|nr:leucine-rich repeat receptor-like protein kinase TDR [Magnolia sinica]